MNEISNNENVNYNKMWSSAIDSRYYYNVHLISFVIYSQELYKQQLMPKLSLYMSQSKECSLESHCRVPHSIQIPNVLVDQKALHALPQTSVG
jgi:hypothetical protein